VAGMPPEEVSYLFKKLPDDSYELLGWQKTEEFLSKINLLIHPALSEPFGMVVAEANAAGVPVLVSTQAGVADLVTDNNGCVLAQNSNEWSSKMIDLLTWGRAVESMNLSWEALANQCVDVYKKLN
jgi:UDP-glucose:(heptosyl)LPS alpha-1,3-glucosyltransferase